MATTSEGRHLTDQHRRAQAALGATVAGQTLEWTRLINPGDIRGSIDPWLEQMLGLLLHAHQQGTALAREYLRRYRACEYGDTTLPIITPRWDVSQAVDSIVWAPRLAQATVAREHVKPEEAWNQVVSDLVGRAMREALAPGRETVARSAEAVGGLWRRVSDGNPCAFCAILVTRGPSYWSRRTAITRGYSGRSYHYYCGCTAEEYRGDPMDWEPTVQEQRYIDLYDRSHQPEMTGKQTVAAMRKSGQGIINDARKPETQAGATGGRPLRQPGASPLGFEGDKGWKSRQDALGVAPRVIVGDLQPGEIQFLERLQAINPDLPLSQQVEWLPLGERVNGQRQPSNDFVWIDHGGIEVELKSPVRNSPGSVIPRIWKAVNTAWDRHEFVKSNFIVDLGEQEFPDALREALAAYNLTRSGPEITSVFVMWQGKIEEIALKQR